MKNPIENVAAMDRINLRLTPETFSAIDAARGARPGRVSRNTWIAEAIEEKLARNVSAGGSSETKKVSNA
jgi:predicted HicB family RNase H-like nuclease